MRIENEATFYQACQHGINLFLGSGFSVLAKNEVGRPLPMASDLKNLLISRFNLRNHSRFDLSQLCTIIESTKAADLREFLCETYRVTEFDPLYNSLDNLALRYIFSTNIDDLVCKIFRQTKNHYFNDVTKFGTVLNDREAVHYYPLHGSISNEDAPLRFSKSSIAAATNADPDLWRTLTSQMQRSPTLFWGYSLADAGVLEALDPATVNNRPLKDRWIALVSPGREDITYFKAFGFKIIESDTFELLRWIEEVQGTSSGVTEKASTKVVFPSEAVPEGPVGPTRPLKEFLLGDVPNWHDVFSNRIHKTEHYATVVESALSNKNSVILGIPGCGKTTVMMQVAAGIQFDGHKLAISEVTTDKAKHILGKLEDDKAIIFIDDFAKNIEPVLELMKAPNVSVVAFDREHNFEIASHLLADIAYHVVDITDLSDSDIQAILSRIPQELRARPRRGELTVDGTRCSLFEFVEANIAGPTLRKRFGRVLAELSKHEELKPLLVMIAYVHSCRTPVSTDMVAAFLKDHLKSAIEVYDWIAELGKMVSEYSGLLAEHDQDHYTPRSNLVSQAILDSVDSPTLRDVLLRVHREISPTRICRYDIFRRSAFDEAIFAKAFTKWEEGRNFYDELYCRDRVPYLRQQGALFLARKKHYNEAFAWIDEALLASGGRIPSIRRSHATILFAANINFAGCDNDGSVRRSLDESMSILMKCYEDDKRKVYHAYSFSDQALKYWETYGDEQAAEYLATAQDWLQTLNNGSYSPRWVREHLSRVSQKLYSAAPNPCNASGLTE